MKSTSYISLIFVRDFEIINGEIHNRRTNKGGMKMFKYYEDGLEKILTFRKVYRMFSLIPAYQKVQGTTFTSWLSEMEKMQILIRFA